MKTSMTKYDVHQHFIVIYIYFKFHEILFSGYLDIAPDQGTERQTEGETWTKQYLSAFGWDKKK